MRILTALVFVTSFAHSAGFLARGVQTNPNVVHSSRAWLRSRSASSGPTSTSCHHHTNHLIALTREEGKNEKLREALEASFDTVELPCIAHANGPDLPQLSQRLKDEPWDYVIITSPEAAKVVAGAWAESGVANNKSSNSPPPRVAAVGKATQEALNEFGIDVCFTPSKATAAVLVVELPGEAPCRIMYPASCKAKDTLQSGLEERGFEVVRLNTYDTVTASWTEHEKEQAKRCNVACFASPSSVHGWLHNTNNDKSVMAACIGETSAAACRKLGWPEERIFYPDQPGIPGWVEAVESATSAMRLSQT